MQFENKTYIMGILNVTPDSFSDGGKYTNLKIAMEHVQKMIEDGADIIDIGGESTRPDSTQITAEEEIKRVVPIISEIRKKYNILISIDTYKSEVAQAAIEAGANIVNDVSGGLYDKLIFDVVKKNNVPMILMHNRFDKTPHAKKEVLKYVDVVKEVYCEIQQIVDNSIKHGVKNIIIDPGIGFAKNKEDNLKLLNNLEVFKELGYPILLGTSRKRFIKEVLQTNESKIEGTLATTAIGIEKGVKIIRCHDVKPNRLLADMIDAIIDSN